MNRQQEQRGREPRRHATDGSPSGGSNRISMRISPAASATRSRALRGEVSMGEHDSGENQKTSLRSVRRAGVTCRHPYGHVHVHAVISGILYVISKKWSMRDPRIRIPPCECATWHQIGGTCIAKGPAYVPFSASLSCPPPPPSLYTKHAFRGAHRGALWPGSPLPSREHIRAPQASALARGARQSSIMSNYAQVCPIMSSGLLGAIELLELGEALGIVLVLELIKDRALLVLAFDQEHLWVDSSDLDGAIKGDPGRSKEIIPAGPQSRP